MAFIVHYSTYLWIKYDKKKKSLTIKIIENNEVRTTPVTMDQ